MLPGVPTEGAYRLLDALAEGIVLLEAGRVVFVNEAAAAFLGVDARQCLGSPLIAVVRDHRLEEAYLKQCAVQCETRGRILRATPVPGGLRLEDLTEQKRSQETARELLAVLSHELRTPVATIRSTLEALQGDLPSDLQARFLERAELESGRLVRLLNDLTVDVKPPHYRSVFLPEVVTRALGLTKDVLETHAITLVQVVEDITVWVDSDKLLQVLINLLENAAIHGPDGETVTLLGSSDPERTGWARLSVQDQGEPLAQETLEQLFEPHARGASVKAKGTGLGLYIVRSIAEAWGGEAWGCALEKGNEFGVSMRLKPG